MTIESASHPADLSQWDGKANATPYYFEVFGETSSLLDTVYAEVVPAGPTADGGTQTTQSAPVYEYLWTIGHPSHRPEHAGLLNCLSGPSNLWERLPDPALRVYFFFPMGGGWTIRNHAARILSVADPPGAS